MKATVRVVLIVPALLCCRPKLDLSGTLVWSGLQSQLRDRLRNALLRLIRPETLLADLRDNNGLRNYIQTRKRRGGFAYCHGFD